MDALKRERRFYISICSIRIYYSKIALNVINISLHIAADRSPTTLHKGTQKHHARQQQPPLTILQCQVKTLSTVALKCSIRIWGILLLYFLQHAPGPAVMLAPLASVINLSTMNPRKDSARLRYTLRLNTYKQTRF